MEKLESQEHQSSIVLFDENWKKGVIGIVASRLTELYYRPTVVLTKFNGIATGSARSVAGYDLYDAIKSCRDLLLNFGGHTYAVGLSLLDINAVVDFKDVTKKLHNDLKKFAPHGPDNPKPLFCTRNVYDYGTSKVVGRQQEHIKLELVDSKSSNVLNGIAFGQSDSARFIKSKRSFDIVYTIEDNIYKRSEVQLQIEDIQPSEE